MRRGVPDRQRHYLMLEVSGLEAGYGDSRVLFGVDLAVGAGEVVTLLGRNGMGKTTTLSTIMGSYGPRAGRYASRARRSTICRPIASPGLGSGWCRKAGRSFPI